MLLKDLWIQFQIILSHINYTRFGRKESNEKIRSMLSNITHKHNMTGLNVSSNTTKTW